MRHLIIGIAFAALATSAAADQQSWISSADAARAVAHLHVGSPYRLFCAPCGDQTWSESEIARVEVAQVSEDGTCQVRVNGRDIDLAYTYVPHNGQWENLALLLGLDASDVPRVLGPIHLDPEAELAMTETELEHLEAALAGSVPGIGGRLQKARRSWERYRDAQSELEKEIAGSDQAGMAARLRLTRDRLDEIQALLMTDP